MINKIVLLKKSNNLLLQILPVCTNKKDKVLLNFNTRKILCDHVEFGTINFNYPIHIDANDFIEEVFYYQFETKFIFIHYPTLTQSN